jgi:hypothetical protein
MSEWAIGDGDIEERTAYEYREFYLDQGIVFEGFTCPFCGVILTPVNLYTQEEIAKSPHFRADKGPHRFGCDGYPKYRDNRNKRSQKRRVEKREFQLPEALVPRRTPVAVRPAVSKPRTTDLPNEHEVNRRREKTAQNLGPAMYRTSLIRTVAIAFLGVLKESYERQKEQNWNKEQQWGWVTKVFKESPLTLYDGYTLTYHTAIRNIRFPPPAKPRIFHGWASISCASRIERSAEYLLTPHAMVEHTQGEDVAQYPVEIRIRVASTDEPMGSQLQTLKKLDRAVRENQDVRWFAYGIMRLHDDDVYRMTTENVDHLYLHTLKKPVDGY